MSDTSHAAPAATDIDRSAEALYLSLSPENRAKVRAFLHSLRDNSCNSQQPAFDSCSD